MRALIRRAAQIGLFTYLCVAFPGRAAAEGDDDVVPPTPPGPYTPEIRLESNVIIGGLPTDLVCDAHSRGSGSEVLLIGEAESTMSELQAIGQRLADRGYPTIIPHLEGLAPTDAASRLAELLRRYEATILARGGAPRCSALRSCSTMGGAVGGELHCYKWTASPPRLFVVLGAGVSSYLELLARSGCARELGGALLVDPDVRDAPLPKRSCEGRNTILRTGLGRCHDGFSRLEGGPLELASLDIITFPKLGHCDAVAGGSACANRCGQPLSDAGSELLWKKAIDTFREDPLAPRVDTPDVRYERVDGLDVESKTKLGVGVIFGAGALTHPGDGPRPVAIAALRPELLFGTRGSRSWSYGPVLEAGWLGASTVSLGGGATLAIPFGEAFTIAPSVGIFAYDRHDGWRRGASASLFVGARSRTTYSAFDNATGLRFEARTDLERGPQRAFFVSYQFDLIGLAAMVGYASNVR